MKKEYDFSSLKGCKNPYVPSNNRILSIDLGIDVIDYFKTMEVETGVPYQTLISLYLRDCAINRRKIKIN